MESIYKNDFINNDCSPLSANFWQKYIRDIRWSHMLLEQGNPKGKLVLRESDEFPVFTKTHKTLPFSRHVIFYMPSYDDIINLRFLDNSHPSIVKLNMDTLAQVAGIKSSTMYGIHLDFPSAFRAIEFTKVMMVVEEEFWMKAYDKWMCKSSENDISQFMDNFCEKYNRDLVSRGWLIFERAILYYILKSKFEDCEMKKLLLKTTDKRLLCITELNNSKTNYLENVLGQIIMFIRSEIKI